MILFPNCKINLGLDILRKRADGYHDIETVMLPVRGLCDVLEVLPCPGGSVDLRTTGVAVDCAPEQNLCTEAYRLMARRYGLGGIRIHLHKIIPPGAGLGGGSADAAFTIRAINSLYSLGLGDGVMEDIAAELGSDTAFFIRNTASLSQGRGEILTQVDVPLGGYGLIIVKPPPGVSTKEAYAGVVPSVPVVPLIERLSLPVDTWKGSVCNAFERGVGEKYPEIIRTIASLYDHGAVFASMSGSGSAVYGLFGPETVGSSENEPAQGGFSEIGDRMRASFPHSFVHQEVIRSHC